MPTRLRLSCRALLIIVLVRPNLSWSQASHQLNPALRTKLVSYHQFDAIAVPQRALYVCYLYCVFAWSSCLLNLNVYAVVRCDRTKADQGRAVILGRADLRDLQRKLKSTI